MLALMALAAWGPLQAQAPSLGRPGQAAALAPIPALDGPVVDTTGTLDATTRARLAQQAITLQQRKGSQIQVLVVATTRPESIEAYAVRVFEQWQLGRKGVDDAVLLVVAMDDRAARIEVGYGLEGAIPDITAARIIREGMLPRFREGDFGGGISAAVAALASLVEGEPLPEPAAGRPHAAARGGGDWMFALFAAFIAASVVRGVVRGLPAGLRGLATAGAAGTVAWLFSTLLALGGLAAMFGFVYGLMAVPRGRYVRHGGWGGFGGGGGWGGGGFGGGMGGGGGWSGGGGMSGGGGASGRW